LAKPPLSAARADRRSGPTFNEATMTTAIEPRRMGVPWRSMLWTLAVVAFLGNLYFAFRSRDAIAAAAARARPLHAPDLSLIPTVPAGIQLHLVAVALAVPLGAAMFFSKKGARLHRVAGWTWVCLMAVGALAPLFALDQPHYGWAPIHLTIPLVLIPLVLAVLFARAHNVRRHRGLMIWVFVMIVFAGLGTLAPSRLVWRMFFG
jgi:uncharacterized membrane protein